MSRHVNRFSLFVLLCATAPGWSPLAAAQTTTPNVYSTTLGETGQAVPEVSTNELDDILKFKREPVYDVRTAKEYAIAHIPGTINIYEKEVEQIIAQNPNRSTPMILYCNGPSCGKSKRTSEALVAAGYSNVRRYQLGMPVWRALSFTVQTDMPGFDYIFRGDHTAVFVDARTPAEHAVATVPGATNVQKGEATAANDDGRLPFTDKGTRVVVFGTTAEQASIVAAEIAKKAYWNSSYFGGMFDDLVAGGFINHPPVAISKAATVGAGPSCTAIIIPAAIDGGSFDVDTADSLTLLVDPAAPLTLGQHTVSLVATDSHGASSATDAVVTIADQTGPAISDLAADRQTLWPPDHQLQPVTVAYATSDNCGPVTTELLVSSGSSGEDRRGPEQFESQVVDAHHVLLAAAREGPEERSYLITVVATDAAGNRSAASIEVAVGTPRR